MSCFLPNLACRPAQMLSALNCTEARYFHVRQVACTKIAVATAFPERYIMPAFETDRITIRRLKLPCMEEILIGALHLPSKLHWDENSQAAECMRVAQLVRSAEEKEGHRRTVLVGDFNMNPFEPGMVCAYGLHGVMTRSLAEKVSRRVQDQDYPFFYNPMWGFYGDRDSSTPGTYYHAGSTQSEFFWHMFDQLLVRPELLPRFPRDSVRILHEVAGVSLLSDTGVPDCDRFSDHLPLLFSLSL